ncbi:Ulp1 protease family, C-terminal catalytic domain containing protein [Parasponia andersonii]|uniref:Ulp1 protease family, C-terminal catalytic domain containing protein n=1 Tax=Parasponia andersonii TaxID=3476 RepID=A0A2P5AM39_PARAD|nr:Ulp1 protease family, C-terminal catalytic domain containing protein [Parasponia andersonii]
MVSCENRLFGQSSMFSPRCYISGSDESFEDVIYPKGDPDAVTISNRDVELLRPETFINDTIIDFYIKYLANKIPSDKKHRFHFFNSFFFRKLVDLDKDPSSAHEGKAAFQRVRKWTRKVNLFEKDYIFIPVNYSLHWSLLVICHPGEAPNLEVLDEESEGTSKVPCILHMDSIKGSHKGLKNLMQSYLCEEWKERHSGRTEDVSSKFLNLRFISLELPQQENLFDCGIFLLHYVELFLEEAPLEFSPFNISKFSKFLSRKWFPPAEASLKRPVIKKLLYEILEDPSQKMSPAGSIAEYSSSVGPNETSSEETGVMFLEKIGRSNKTCHDTASSSSDEKIGISLSETSPLRGDQCFRESGAFSKSSTDVNSQLSVLRRSILSPIEEGEEGGSQVAESPLVTGGCQQVAGPTSDLFSSSHISNLETLGNHEVSMHRRKLDDGDSVSGTSSGSQTFSEVEIYEALQLQDSEGCDHMAEPDKEESSSTSCEELAACVVQDSEEDDSNEIKCISSTGVENDVIVLRDQSTKNVIRKRNNLPSRNDDAVSESYVLKTTKMRRLKTTEGGRRLTRSLSKLSIASLMAS